MGLVSLVCPYRAWGNAALTHASLNFRCDFVGCPLSRMGECSPDARGGEAAGAGERPQARGRGRRRGERPQARREAAGAGRGRRRGGRGRRRGERPQARREAAGAGRGRTRERERGEGQPEGRSRLLVGIKTADGGERQGRKGRAGSAKPSTVRASSAPQSGSSASSPSLAA